MKTIVKTLNELIDIVDNVLQCKTNIKLLEDSISGYPGEFMDLKIKYKTEIECYQSTIDQLTIEFNEKIKTIKI